MSIKLEMTVKGKNKNNSAKLRKKALSERRKAQRIIDKANKRIQRLEKSDLKNLSVALRNVQKDTQKFSIQGKTGEELQATIQKAQDFLAAQTSTIRGLNEYAKKVSNAIGIPFTGKNFKQTISTKISAVWDIESKLSQVFTSSRQARYYQYNQLIKRASEFVKDSNLFNKKMERGTKEYENAIEKATSYIQKAMELEGEAMLEDIADNITNTLGKNFTVLD